MQGRKKKYGDELNPEILQRYTEKMESLSQISIEMQMHPEVVKRKLKLMGIDIRNKSSAMKLHYKKRAKEA